MAIVTSRFDDLVGRDYEVVYADPPWRYYGDPNKPQAAGKHYPTMGPAELGDLPVHLIIARKSVIFMWTTSAKMEEAIFLMRRWCFFYRGVAWVWVKTTRDGRIISGQGVRPSFVKPTCEYLLVGSTLSQGRPFPILDEAMANVVLHHRPGNVHSRKPTVFRENIERLLGDRKRVELFARDVVIGWDSWGNELKGESGAGRKERDDPDHQAGEAGGQA